MKRIIIKYGGNAMLSSELQRQIISAIVDLKEKGHQFIIVHGGGPFIQAQLEQAGIASEFIDGHRKTTAAAMPHVEMALKGKVNGQLVSHFNTLQSKALGISGKDAQVVLAEQRLHELKHEDGTIEKVSLGQVGDVVSVNDAFLSQLLEMEITPVIACIGTGTDGTDYNINADMMAGHIAGAIKADHLLVLTDIDGLRLDVEDPATHISNISIGEVKKLFGNAIKGGMIPKIEACIKALEEGADEATIINGTKPDLLTEKLIKNKNVGTTIKA
ncbi:MAG: acetylglutamate kinase [Saprospiraceae bacterium]|nr:acetylglutamate kinase [Saprospiraceae bacterium]